MDRNSDALRASKKQSQIRSFNRLLVVMNHQRILVMAIAVAQTALSHFILFLVCLGLIHAKEIADILLLDRLEQKEREEYYETPKFHGVSTNDIRFMEANQLSTYTLVIMYMATAIAGVYALCTLGLLIGTMKRRCELMLPWLVFHSIVCILSGMGLLVTYLHRNQYFDNVIGDGYTVCKGGTERCRGAVTQYFIGVLVFFHVSGFFGILVFFTNIFLWYVVRAYYESLKMMKRLTEEVVVPIPCPVVPFHFRKENMYIGDGGYKHLLSDASTQNFVV